MGGFYRLIKDRKFENESLQVYKKKRFLIKGWRKRRGNQAASLEVILTQVWPHCHPFFAGTAPGSGDAPDASMRRSSPTWVESKTHT